MNEVEDSAIELVPPDAVFYTNLYLNPSTRQKQALRDLLRHFPATETTDDAGARLEDAFDILLRPLGLEFADDVRPWIGRQVGAYAFVSEPGTDPTGAVLIATKDADATRDAVDTALEELGETSEQRTYEGVDYEVTGESGMAVGIVGGFLVVASGPDGLEASVDAEAGDSLGEADGFRASTQGLPTDRVGLFYVNLGPFFEILRGAGLQPVNVAAAQRAYGAPAAAVAYLRADAVVLEAALPGAGGAPGDILADVPAVASVALAVEDLRGFVESQLEILGPISVAGIDVALQNASGLDLADDVLSWMGGFAFYANLDDPSDPFVVARIESRDATTSTAALERLKIALIRWGTRLHPVSIEGLEGFRVTIDDPPTPLLVLDGDGAVTIATSHRSARSAVQPGETLDDDPQYRAALDSLGEGFEAAAFARAGSIVDVIGRDMARTSPDDAARFEEVEPNLEPLSFAIYGTRRAGDRTFARLVVGVR